MTQRLKYIDAARGLAIFTVVYSHICLFCLPDYHASSALIDFLRTYFLNGFFLISGIMAGNTVCNGKNALNLLWRRTYQLLIPALVVGLIYAYSHHISVGTFIFNEAKCGYWFTISLFEMYVTYYVFLLFTNRYLSGNISSAIFTIICFSLYFVFKSRPLPETANDILCWGNTIFYIPFFSIGILANRFKYLINKIMEIGGGKFVFILFVCTGISFSIPTPLLIQRLLVVVLVIWIIRKIYSQEVNYGIIDFIKKFLLLVGTNSLEIYFLHYFILFSLPTGISRYLETVSVSDQSLSMIEFIIVGTMSVVISFTSVTLSRILKNIPYVSLLGFGKSKA